LLEEEALPRSAGARRIRWAVDLTPAEFALVEAVRGALRRTSRADFLLILTREIKDQLRHPSEAVEKASSLVQLERDEELGADRVEHGGRPPVVRLMTAEQWIMTHAAMRSDPGLAKRLANALYESEDEDDGTADRPGFPVAPAPLPP
jgi:hypothetical protein